MAYKGKSNYYKVGLSKDGKVQYVRVHRLVAEAFIPNEHNKPQVDHIDGDTTNNNPFYAGKVKHKLIDNEMVDGVHEAAISYAEFLKVQDIMSGKTGVYKHVTCSAIGTKHR